MLNTRVALPVKGPAVGKLPDLRTRAKVTSSPPALLVIDVLNCPPGATAVMLLVRSMTTPTSGLSVARAVEANAALVR